MTVFNDSGSLSDNSIFCGSCSRSRREDLAVSSSVTIFASVSTKTIVPVLVRPTQVLDEGDSSIPPRYVQGYVPGDGLVRKSVDEMRQRSEVWRKRMYKCVKTEDKGLVIPRRKCEW